MLRSTTARFIFFLFTAQLLATSTVLFYVSRASESAMVSEQRRLVLALRDDLVADYDQAGVRALEELIESRLARTQSDVVVLLLTDRTGKPLVGNLDAWPTFVGKRHDWLTTDLVLVGSDAPSHIGLTTTVLRKGERLLTGHVIDGDMKLVRINQRALLAALLLEIPIALLVALLLGRMISSRVKGIVDTAGAVSQGQLSRRVSGDGSGDAFDRLGQSVNRMLERIERLVSELRLISDSLAHDLRSPVTRLRSAVERAAAETSDPVALAALERVGAEANTLLSMLSTALQISRAEAGIGRDQFTPTRVDELLRDIVEIYGPLAEDQGFALTCNDPGPVVVSLHRELVSQALGNLVENALKHGVGGSHVRIEGEGDAGRFAFSVADDGPGIAAEDRLEAMRRFGRLDPARHLSGSGLGLALVEAIAKLHGGEVRLEDNAPGLKAIITVHGPDWTE